MNDPEPRFVIRIRSLVAAALLLSTSPATSQDAVAAAERGCSEAARFVAGYVERNYAGFEDKVKQSNQRAYEHHRRIFYAQADEASGGQQCAEALREYTDFFRDPHLGIASGVSATREEIRDRFSGRPSRQLSEADARAYFERRGSHLDEIEGVWEILGSDYRLAVLASDSIDGRYEAVTLDADGAWWVPGQIKATFAAVGDRSYEASYYMRDHSLREELARLNGTLLRFSTVSAWAKVHPDGSGDVDLRRYREQESSRELAIRELEPNTLLLRLPSFLPAAEAKIQTLVEDNWDRLASADTLLIDVRGNGGGSDASFQAILPLLYTGPMITPGLSHFATDENIQRLSAFAESEEITDELAASVRGMIERMRHHRGEYVPTPDARYEIEAPLPYPRRVAVLADRGCASSCEAFVWLARQSAKTTIFGQNTGGFLDYGDALLVETPIPEIQLQVPMARSNRVPRGMPLDNVGIEPDVRVPDDVLYWVDWVREQLR